MVGIEASDRDSGFRIFESMNDRGARLTSVDLMKSFLLSRAKDGQQELNASWRAMIAEVTRQRGDADAPKEFLRAYLISQHADIASGSDVQEIINAPHIWARRNLKTLGLTQEGEPYQAFVSNLIDLGRVLGKLTAATKQPYEMNGASSLYYNHVNGATAQMALILATICSGDLTSTIDEKARIAANFVDLLVVHRTVNDESTRQDDLNAEIHGLIPLVRRCPTPTALSSKLGALVPPDSFDGLPNFGLRGDNRSQFRYILARLTAYTEIEMGHKDAIDQYLSSDDPWHSEHLFADHPGRRPNLVPREFRAVRNRIGGLGLLKDSDNPSIRDLAYADKIEWYRSRNTLLAALSPHLHRNNPSLRRFRSSHELDGVLRAFKADEDIREVVEQRGRLYRALAGRVWSHRRLGLTPPPADATESGGRSTPHLPTPGPPA
ncbi:hypothetical protein WIS52_25695 [Pseudonocardia nematodicida]|uniref:GmrSD restriction endonucleases C-terminal domain-containing protein n=1 Tax=Pseudonocardia nematodicida TaxID=1206997 RepID=A0ABV1KHH0_9PSEU